MSAISEAEKVKIQKGAQELLAKFSSTLSKVKLEKKETKKVLGGFREEKEGKNCDSDFRERMFANAPHKEGDFILAEKKIWH